MDDNPYRSPGPSHNESFSLEQGSTVSREKQVLPRLFWRIWVGYTLLSVAGMVYGLSSGSSGFWNTFIGASILSPFILFRAVRCERYQHQCIVFHGVSLFLAQWGVCFGLLYLSLGLMMIPILWLGRWNPLVSSSSSPFSVSMNVAWVQVLLVGTAWLALYLGLLNWSACRPRLRDLRDRKETAPDADR